METGFKQRDFHIVIYLLLSGLLTFAKVAEPEQRRGNKPNKPTNSITIRQSSICLNHAMGEFVKNPDDCKLFYLCMENGEAVLASCPPTMLFNTQTQLCDVAANVQCNVTDESETGSQNESETFGSEILDAPAYCATLTQQMNRIVFIGSSSDCRQYYICYYGQALLQECSADLHWNANVGKCDLPAKAACTLGISASQQSGVGSQQNGGTQQQNNGNANMAASELINCPTYGEHIFPHMEHCEFFIFCVKGHAILQRCPFYYHFDIIDKTCKWRTTALCVRDLNI